ncbi:Crp/Fnr family transcriptional regulator [Achromobacter sp. F4_2707]|uniref:Crp/Fnr family transcriptional regulator n=1 Tax=Achromobacter sp. F4_2707 TaxID=3114286 RepID=UPI0039C5F1E2
MSLEQSLLTTTAWFPVLEPEEQQRVLRDLHSTHYAPGAMIERKGELATSWLGVQQGLARVSVGNPDGKLASLTGMPAGSWFGEGSLLKHEKRKYDVVALRATTILRMPEATFNWLLDRSRPFNRYLLDQLNERAGQFIGRAESDRLLDPEARVARCLLELVNPTLLTRAATKRLDITQEEIGYLARISRQRANQALRNLEENKLISVEYGAIHILDTDGLAEYGQ